jgi:polyhydroxyalkanoate synthesis regulator phasin
MSEKEGKVLIDELLKKSEQARDDLETKVEDTVSKVLGRMDLATKGDIDRLAEEIKRLEQKEHERDRPGIP